MDTCSVTRTVTSAMENSPTSGRPMARSERSSTLRIDMRILKVIAIVMIAASAHAQTTRDAFGPVGAPAIEAVILQLYNGSHLQWTPKVAVVLAEGSAKSIRIAESATRQAR